MTVCGAPTACRKHKARTAQRGHTRQKEGNKRMFWLKNKEKNASHTVHMSTNIDECIIVIMYECVDGTHAHEVFMMHTHECTQMGTLCRRDRTARTHNGSDIINTRCQINNNLHVDCDVRAVHIYMKCACVLSEKDRSEAKQNTICNSHSRLLAINSLIMVDKNRA